MKEFKIIFRVLLVILCFSPCVLAAQDSSSGQGEEIVADYVPPQPDAPRDNFFGFVGTLFRIGLVLTLVVVFIYITVFILKNMMTPSRPGEGTPNIGSLFLVDSLSLRLNQTIHLVSVGKKILILAATDRDITVLSTIDDAQTVKEILDQREEKWNKARPFGEYLQDARKKQYFRMYMKEYVESVKKMFKGKREG